VQTSRHFWFGDHADDSKPRLAGAGPNSNTPSRVRSGDRTGRSQRSTGGSGGERTRSVGGRFTSLLLAVWATLAFAPGQVFAEVDAAQIKERASASTPLKFHYPQQYEPAIRELDAVGGDAVRRLEDRLAIEKFPAVDVWVLPEVNDYFELTEREGRAPKWAIGLSLGDRRTVIVARDTPLPGGVESDLEKTFIHELAHVAIDIAGEGGHVPRWFHEGFALSQAREWTPERRQKLTRAASTDALIPFAELDGNFPAHHNVASLAYAQSFHFVEFLEQNHGEGVTAEVMESVRAGKEFEEAVRGATGRGLDALETDWRGELSSETSWLALLQDEFAIFFVAAVFFAIAWAVRRDRLRGSSGSGDGEAGDLTYDKSRYPLPGEPRDR